MMSKYFLCVLLLLSGWCNALAGTVPRRILLEHFTQAGCGPCAYFNPTFEEYILRRNPLAVHHITYHTSWPGTDPMYEHSRVASDARTGYYGVFSVPKVMILGDNTAAETFEGNQYLIDSIVAAGSPVEVVVSEQPRGTARDVRVRLRVVGEVPPGEYRLRLAVVERRIEYPFPPGSNGERVFPNVFRRMVPDAGGHIVELPEVGGSTTLEFTYALHPEWQADQIYVIAFLQNEETLEVLNSGSSRDSYVTLGAERNYRVSTGSAPVTFSVHASNALDIGRRYRLRIVPQAPPGWSATLTIDDTVYTGEAPLTLAAWQLRSFECTVTPSGNPGVGSYAIELLAVDEPQVLPVVQYVYLVHNVVDLVVGNGTVPDSLYSALSGRAGSPGVGMIDAAGFGQSEAGVWSGVRHIYYHAGWNFPTLTERAAIVLAQHIDRGGNLLISGQDIGWDQMAGRTKLDSDTAPAALACGTPATHHFYQEYLGAAFFDDGAGNSPIVTVVPGNGIFTQNSVLALTDAHGYLAPDVILPLGNAVPVCLYNGVGDDAAGVRSMRGQAKIVYLAFGLEMVDAGQRHDILVAARHWFEGQTTDVAFDDAVRTTAGAVPCPATTDVTIAVPGAVQLVQLLVFDGRGRTVANREVVADGMSIRLSVDVFPAGVYFYRLLDGGKTVGSGTFHVAR